MKKQIVTDAEVILTPRRWHFRGESSLRELDAWCQDLSKFIRDHRSRDQADIEIRKMTEYRCSFCNSVWEEDENGPVCCQAAQDEHDAEKAVQT